MLTKAPKAAGFRRLLSLTVKVGLVVEGVGLALSYGLWYKLNTERDFRLYMYKNHDWVLEGFYGLGEKLGGQDTREVDRKIWSSEGKI